MYYNRKRVSDDCNFVACADTKKLPCVAYILLKSVERYCTLDNICRYILSMTCGMFSIYHIGILQ